MAHTDFVHLHLHTEYSLLDGACRIDRLLDRAKELEFPALALTDHGVLYGAIDFYQAARKREIKPIIGCEVYVAPGDRRERKAGHRGRDAYNHLLLLAQNQEGYRNLVQLVTAAHLEGYYYKPRIDKELLAQRHEGLIALSGCLASEIPSHIHQGRLDQARDSIDWFRQTFGADNFYLELQDHGIPEQAIVNQQLIAWSREFGLKLVATNDVHYVRKEDWQAHDCLICIGTQSRLSDTKRMRYQEAQFFLRSGEEMAERFREVPEAVRNTMEVAEKCNLEIEFGKLHYPVYNPPEHFTREGYLRHVLAEAMKKRYGLQLRAEGETFIVEHLADPRRLPSYHPAKPVAEGEPLPGMEDPEVKQAVQVLIDRLQNELGVIESTGFVSYFLIVGDFVRYGREQGISCVARGSAAGSLVTYLLEISNVDPIQYGLLFERFLNPERVNPPDIDIDFADDRRADVIEYVRQIYGKESVAQIITFGTMGAKSVVRDVGRVMGLEYGHVDRLAKMIPNELKMTLAKALKTSPDLKQAYDTEEVTRELIDTAFILEDLTRNASVHAAGVVIGGEPLADVLPLKEDENGATVTQYAMGPVGDLGLLKMDFLGLKTLTVIRNTCDMVKKTQGIEVPIDELPLDDAQTYQLLNDANTLGVFQLESGGMRDLCRKFKIGSVEHITALIALYRPGPMDLIPEFIRRRHGQVKIEYEHPLLEPICRETYGVMVYQEQVMQATQVLAGYTLGGADLLRRAMGKKKVEEMQKQRKTFVEGCHRINGIPAAQANRIFDLLEKFAGYGFNKSHAAAYAVVAYQTAYLKAHYPVEFLCAMMTNDMADTAKLNEFITESKSMGIDVLPPDVNESQVVFAPAQGGKVIRFGLAAIKGVGEVVVQNIIKAREEGERFRSLAEMCERVDGRTVNRKALEALIRCGACDCFQETRATQMAEIDRVLSRAATITLDRERGQASLFGLMEASPLDEDNPSNRLAEWPKNQCLAAEKELLGFYFSGHPLTPHLPLLERYALTNSKTIIQLEARSVTRIGGLVTTVQSGFSKKSNKPYAIVTLEDLHGSVQVLVMNENHDKYRELLEPDAVLLVVGEVSPGEDRPKIFPQTILRLEDAPAKFTQQVHLRFQTDHLTGALLENALALVTRHPGRCPLFLCLTQPSGTAVFVEANDRFSVTPSRELQEQVDALLGQRTYYAKVDTSTPERTTRPWERKTNAPSSGDGE